jgi:hypothetical protein
MDVQEVQNVVIGYANELAVQFQKIPGSAILLRYIRSSYQNDPVRSAVEAFLFLFVVRYLLSPKYSTKKEKNVKLSEEVCPSPPRNPENADSNARRRRSMNWWTTGCRSPWSDLSHPLKSRRTRSDRSLLGV